MSWRPLSTPPARSWNPRAVRAIVLFHEIFHQLGMSTVSRCSYGAHDVSQFPLDFGSCGPGIPNGVSNDCGNPNGALSFGFAGAGPDGMRCRTISATATATPPLTAHFTPAGSSFARMP